MEGLKLLTAVYQLKWQISRRWLGEALGEPDQDIPAAMTNIAGVYWDHMLSVDNIAGDFS